MQDDCGSNCSSLEAADESTVAGSALDDDARRRLAAKLLQAMRDAGYDCELLEENLH